MNQLQLLKNCNRSSEGGKHDLKKTNEPNSIKDQIILKNLNLRSLMNYYIGYRSSLKKEKVLKHLQLFPTEGVELLRA